MNQYPPSGWNGQPSGPQNNPPTSEFGPVQPQQQPPQHQQQPQAQQQFFPPAPPQQPNPYGYGPPPKQGMSTPLVVGLTVAIVLLLGLIVGAAFLVVPRLMGTAGAPTTSTVSVTATAPAENGSGGGSGADAVPTVQPARPAPSGKPAGAYECWSGGSAAYNSVAVGSSVTSCEFAEVVWSRYVGSGGNGQSKTVRAYSPVTGRSYTMSCSGGSVVTCTGGDNAVVHIY